MPLYGKHAFAQWYTLGGPFVRRHNGRYYCFFSGANFLTDRYGVDYCGADRIMGPYANSGSDAGALVLHLVRVRVHVREAGNHARPLGPDGCTEYLIYYAWNPAMPERSASASTSWSGRPEACGAWDLHIPRSRSRNVQSTKLYC